MNAKLWTKADAAARRYFKQFSPPHEMMKSTRVIEHCIFRSAWAMGYRAGKRAAK